MYVTSKNGNRVNITDGIVDVLHHLSDHNLEEIIALELAVLKTNMFLTNLADRCTGEQYEEIAEYLRQLYQLIAILKSEFLKNKTDE